MYIQHIKYISTYPTMYEKKGISVACGTIELSLRCALFSHSGQGYASLALFIWFSIKTVGLFSPSIIEEDVVDTPRGLTLWSKVHFSQLQAKQHSSSSLATSSGGFWSKMHIDRVAFLPSVSFQFFSSREELLCSPIFFCIATPATVDVELRILCGQHRFFLRVGVEDCRNIGAEQNNQGNLSATMFDARASRISSTSIFRAVDAVQPRVLLGFCLLPSGSGHECV